MHNAAGKIDLLSMHGVTDPDDRVACLLYGADMPSKMSVNLRTLARESVKRERVVNLICSISRDKSNSPDVLGRIYDFNQLGCSTARSMYM